MSRVLSTNLKKDSVYCFITRGFGKIKGTLLNEEDNVLVIETKNGIDKISKGDIYFYHSANSKL